MASKRHYPKPFFSYEEEDFMNKHFENNLSGQENVDPAAEREAVERQRAQIAFERNHLRRMAGKSRHSRKRVFSIWQRMLATLVAGAAIGLVISLTIFFIKKEQLKGNFLDCGDPETDIDEICIEEGDAQSIRSIMTDIHRNLTVSLGLLQCGNVLGSKSSLDFKALKEWIAASNVHSKDKDLLVESIYQLILKNPHWNLRLVDRSGNQISSWTRFNVTAVTIEAAVASRSLWCRITRGTWLLWSWLKWLIAALFLAFIGYSILQCYTRKRENDIRATFIMVDRILEVLRRHYEAAKKDDNMLPFIAIVHVRDMILSPPERKSKRKVWDRAVEWIAIHDSRVRVESRQIAGEEFMVWRWIQIAPPPTDNPAYSKREEEGMDNVPDRSSLAPPPPHGAPSRCIRLKNMFETLGTLSSDQIETLEKAILDKCPRDTIKHIKVDRRSPHGCVYFKMDSLQAASRAYKAFNGMWFKGKLITGKYIPELKYDRWFPMATKV